MIILKKLFFVFTVCAVLLFAKTASFAEDNIQLTGDEFLTRLSNTLFRVRNGFSNDQVFSAEHCNDGILLSYNSSVFLTIRETPPPREIKNISVVLMAQDRDKETTGQKADTTPADNIVFEDICMQVMYALHPQVKESDIRRVMKELGFDGELLDGSQRSVRFEYCKYIMKYNSNGMLIMVVSSL